MRFHRAEKRKVRATVDLTPLIDVVFQLLVFFMLSSTFVVQSSIPIEVPEAQGTTTLEQKDLTITLQHGEGGPGGKGPVFLNNVPIETMAELSRVLSQRRAENADINLLIRPDTRVSTGRLVEVLGIAASVGIDRYSVAAQPPREE